MQLLQQHHLLGGAWMCRPLLQSTKPQIIAFCQQIGISYFEDETNTNLATSQRNFLRHEIIEKLVRMNN
jgi:tRNA(Ile)-lysidine synthase TilS/MesJ